MSTSGFTATQIEEKIAELMGMANDGRPFTLSQIEDFVVKLDNFDKEKSKDYERRQKEELERQEKERLTKKLRMTDPSMLFCTHCGNSSEERFDRDDREAQLTCKDCGHISKERQLHDGEWVRNFEGESNPGFHGPPADLRYGAAYNLTTGMITLPGSKGKEAKDLAMVQKTVSL